MFKASTVSAVVTGLFWFAVTSLLEDYGRQVIGDDWWRALMFFGIAICFAWFVLSLTAEARRALQHYKGGVAKKELYTAGHIPKQGWQRWLTLAAPYLSSLAVLVVAGLLGWSVIENIKNHHGGSLPISFRAASFHHSPISGDDFLRESVVLQLDEIINHSNEDLSLEFTMLVRLHTPNGERTGMAEGGEWRAGYLGKPEGEATQIVTLVGRNVTRGWLVFRFPKLSNFKEKDWADISNENFLLMITEKVSRRTIQCSPFYYQPGLEKSFADIE